MSKYFGGDTPFEGYAPLYQVKQKEGQSVRYFGVTLSMLGIYLGRRHASVMPKKKEYLTKRNFGQHDGILNKAGKEDSGAFRFFDFYDFITTDYFEGTNRYFSGTSVYATWFSLATAKVAGEGQVSDACEGGKHHFVKQPYLKNPDDTQRKAIMHGLPNAQVWPTMELRTTVRVKGNGTESQFYQDGNRPGARHKGEVKHEIEAENWPTIENGMGIGTGQLIKKPEVIKTEILEPMVRVMNM